MKIKSMIIAVSLLFMLQEFCYGATYYISPSGSDTTGNGTSGFPWATIRKGIGSMSGGDTLILKDGTSQLLTSTFQEFFLTR